MNSSIKSALISLIIVFVTAVALALLPVTVEVTPSTVSADQPGEVEKAVTTSDNLHAAHAMKPVVDVAAEAAPAAETTIREYTLVTIIGQTPAMAFIGSGGEIDGQINPTLTANVGDTVRITVINGDPVLHNLVIDEFGVHTGDLIEKDQTSVVEFVADRPGEFNYYCNIPGHREIGMAGLLKVEGEAPAGEPAAGQPVEVAVQPTALPADPNAVSIVRDPTDLPSPIGDREPMHVQVDLTTEEVVGTLAVREHLRFPSMFGEITARAAVSDDKRFDVHPAAALSLRPPAGRLVRHLELDDFPARRVFVPGLPPRGIDDRAVVPADSLCSPFRYVRRDLAHAAEGLYGDDREIERLRHIHLIHDPVPVIRVQRAEHQYDLRFTDLIAELVLQRLLAPARRDAVRGTAVHVEKIRCGFEILEHAMVILVLGEGMRDVHADRISLRHRP